MLEKKEYKGYFYTPENPDKKISGILYFYPNEKIRLELIGSCLSGSQVAHGLFCEHKEIETIFGVVKTDRGVSNVTLLHCYGSRSRSVDKSQNCKICLVNYSCHYLLIGKHLADRDDKVFNKIGVSFPCFSDWYRDNGIQEEDSKDICTRIFKITNSQKNPRKFQLNETETLIINGYSDTYNTNRYDRCLYEKSYIALESTEKSKLLDLLFNIGWFKDFYSFTAMTAMPFSEIYLYDNDDVEDGVRYPNPVQLFFVSEEKFEKRDKHLHNFLFSFKEIENNFGTIMQKWYEHKENSEPIIQHLIYSVTYRKTIKNSDFLFVIQAIEGYYRRFEEYTSLENILKKLYCKYADIQIIANNTTDIDQVVASRNYYSHLCLSHEKQKENVCKGWDLFGLAEKLKPLLICCILTLIGFENKEIDKLLSKHYMWSGNSFLTTSSLKHSI